MQLYGYFRSSAAYRVRIVANLKGITLDHHPVNLVKGEQRDADNLARNPQGLVPTLVTDQGQALTQSLALCEYLDERYPEPPLLPGSAEHRAKIRALAQAVALQHRCPGPPLTLVEFSKATAGKRLLLLLDPRLRVQGWLRQLGLLMLLPWLPADPAHGRQVAARR